MATMASAGAGGGRSRPRPSKRAVRATRVNAGMAHALWQPVNAPGAGRNREGRGLKMARGRSATAVLRSNAGGATRGKARAAQVHTMKRTASRSAVARTVGAPGRGVAPNFRGPTSLGRVPSISMPRMTMPDVGAAFRNAIADWFPQVNVFRQSANRIRSATSRKRY